MLNIGKLAAGGEDYYLTSVARSVESYYLGQGEARGRWLGRGLGALGLSGTVSGEDLRAVLRGTDPATGDRLTARPNRRVPGFDLAFRPPKSVSIMWALSDERTSMEIRHAHDRAVAAAVGFLEDEAIRSRRGRNGVERVAVDGVVAAAFRHRTSRNDDPLLHTHVVVANVVQASDDGVWRTLDSRSLYRWSKTAGFVYQAQLRHELTDAVGVAWEPVTNGYADIAGVPRELIEAFSSRRAEILARLDERGDTSARAAEVAALDTRSAKDRDIDVLGLVDGWRDTAAELGFDRAELNALLQPGRTPAPVDLTSTLRRMASADGLTANRSTFDRRDVIRAWAEAHPDGADAERLRELTDATLAPDTGKVIDLDGPDSDVRRLAATEDERRYSTPEMLAVEQRMLDRAARRVDDHVGVATPAAAGGALRDASALSDEQRVMVRELIGSGRGIEVVVGKAGSGKTTALSIARRAWEASGVQVTGCALAARAARELERSAGIRSATIHRLFSDLDRYGERAGLAPGSVVVVDEAGMVGTRMLSRVLDHAERAGAKVVLVGDHHQLPEIEAGGAFAALARRLPAIELTDNRRQAEAWERQALDALRDGDPAEAVAAYRRHERIDSGDAETARIQLVGDWWEAVVEHDLDAIMIAARRNDVADLNARARQRLARDGRLTGPTLTAADRDFRIGERVVCLRNDHTEGIVNGMRGTVTVTNPDRGALGFRPDDEPDRLVVLRRGYLDAGHLDHGYAITAHKAQGMTCDATFVLADDSISREWAYVAMSRGRVSNRLYLTDSSELELHDDLHHGAAHPEPALDEGRLPDQLHRSRAQHLAVEQQLTL